MNKKLISTLIEIVIIISIFSCAEKKEAVSVDTHPEGWNTMGSENFHGIVVIESAGHLQNCSGCHGEDYMGNGVEEMSCYQSGCHEVYPHPDGFDDEGSSDFHGTVIAEELDWDKTSCQSCHGADYLGEGYSVKNCVACHDNIYPHADGFDDDEATNFHGTYIAQTLDFDITNCANCHGTNHQGNGYDGKNCYTCHEQYPHKTGFAQTGSENFHGDFIADSLSGEVTSCATCHGTDYQGNGYEEKNCQSCHALYPHGDDYASPASANFHGNYIAETLNFDLSVCQSCHGNDFTGDGNANKNCYTCHTLYPHTDDFDDEESDNFHGEYIEETLDYNLTSCQGCHDTDFSGNGYEQKNCRSCHEEYPHVEDFTDTLSADFHGMDLAENYNWDASSCQECHGDDYTGDGYEGKNCRGCHEVYPHIEDFDNPGLPDYHGQYIIEDLSFDISSCANCHGNDFSGEGYEEKDCRDCHEDYPHPQQFTNSSSDDFHGVYLAEEYNWVMDECQNCHGENYNGDGYNQKNCKSCHPGPDGPEDCNTCHGSMQNDAPPIDLAGNSETTNIGVGAHQAHLLASDLSSINSMECSACHFTPVNYKDSGHLNDGSENAEVVFNAFVTDSGRVNAQWDHSSASCNNIYCHGAFEFDEASSSRQFVYLDSMIVGNNPELIWTNVGSGQADCGSCHSLPPTGHNDTFGDCDGCHGTVVDDALNIIDINKHINGEINVYE